MGRPLISRPASSHEWGRSLVCMSGAGREASWWVHHATVACPCTSTMSAHSHSSLPPTPTTQTLALTYTPAHKTTHPLTDMHTQHRHTYPQTDMHTRRQPTDKYRRYHHALPRAGGTPTLQTRTDAQPPTHLSL